MEIAPDGLNEIDILSQVLIPCTVPHHGYFQLCIWSIVFHLSLDYFLTSGASVLCVLKSTFQPL